MSSQSKSRVLVVDDLPQTASSIAAMVQALGHEATVAHGVEEALAAYDARPFDVVLTDVRMHTLGGFDLLHEMRARSEFVPVILMTGDATIGDSIDAVQAGAFDYVSKPLRLDRIEDVLTRALAWRDQARRTLAEGSGLLPRPALGGIIGSSIPMLEAFKTVGRVADGDANVLILGENGTGKGMVAHELHRRSMRSRGPYVVVNSASIAHGVAESELFGHRRGSFTSAESQHRGYFERASGGTLFLDEIGDLDLGLQAKLLRTLQDRVVRPVGSETEIPVDVRLVTATNRDIQALVREGRFRDDLYYRLAVVTIELPPLRERRDDIPQLAEYFLTVYAEKSRKQRPILSAEVRDRLMEYPWPGNVRELQNVIQRAVQLSQLGVLTPEMLDLRSLQRSATPPAAPGSRRGASDWPSLERVKTDYILEVLAHTGGNLTRAAKILRVSRRTLQRLASRIRQPAATGDMLSHSK
jgi:two-component system response regulator HydG